jgi:hypothetical protein
VPFFEGRNPGELYAARPFDYQSETPWYMVAANGFDIQHFRGAHDRTLIEEPTFDEPSPFARRITARFEVTGTTLRDRLTRSFSGPVVKMTVTSWLGMTILVTAEFRRTTSYGMVCVQPVDETQCRVRNIVWIPRSKNAMRNRMIDPIDAAIRRSFIQAFVRSDRERSTGIRYNPRTLIGADASVKDYFEWLANTSRGC